eukprot:7496542-Pyramimonas_sp.AAC.1
MTTRSPHSGETAARSRSLRKWKLSDVSGSGTGPSDKRQLGDLSVSVGSRLSNGNLNIGRDRVSRAFECPP